jgi:hypothetical protein
MTETWVYLIKNHSVLAICAGLAFLVGACSSTLSSVKTFEDPDYADASFSNILVIGVAGSYESRARWERTMASRISSRGASATAYHSVVGRNQEIDRNSVTNAVRANQFDAVLSDVTVKRGASTAKVSRMEDRPIDLFRYDYEVLNNPESINVETTVVLSTELFAADDEKRIWAIESTVSDKENVSYLIEDAVDMIVGELDKDRLIGR